MSEYVDVDIIENGKVIGSFKSWHEELDEATKQRIKTYSAFNDYESKDLMLQTLYEAMQKQIEDFKQTNHELAELSIARNKENEQLRADYDKQKEINKELVDDMAELHKRIRELETQIKQMNEQEARDIRTRFPC